MNRRPLDQDQLMKFMLALTEATTSRQAGWIRISERELRLTFDRNLIIKFEQVANLTPEPGQDNPDDHQITMLRYDAACAIINRQTVEEYKFEKTEMGRGLWEAPVAKFMVRFWKVANESADTAVVHLRDATERLTALVSAEESVA